MTPSRGLALPGSVEKIGPERVRARAPAGDGSSDISVLLVEDHLALRDGLELLLRVRGIHLAGVAGSADEGFRLYAARRPHVAIIDLTLGAESGVSTVARILELDSDAGVLVYAGLADRDAIESSAACGARGFVLKAGGSHELVAAIGAVAGGGVYVDPAVTAILTDPAPPRVLTGREQEILQLLAAGVTSQRAAKLLFVSPETIRTHIRNAMRKLDARTRPHAVALALNLGEIRAPSLPAT